jgi:hypothetical protein
LAAAGLAAAAVLVVVDSEAGLEAVGSEAAGSEAAGSEAAGSEEVGSVEAMACQVD